MEALTAASIAALTIYDMCKAIDKGFSINTIRLLEKNRRKIWRLDGCRKIATHLGSRLSKLGIQRK